MVREFSRTFSCISLVFLCLTIGVAPWGRQAAAEGSNAERKKEIKFEVISIRQVKPGWSPYDPAPAPMSNTNPSPDGFSSTLTVWQMLMIAYAPVGQSAWESIPMTGGPKWLYSYDTAWYVINARVSSADVPAWRSQSNHHELLSSAMQDLLKARFRLAVHEQPMELPDLKLVIGKKGLKMKAWAPGSALPKNGHPLPTGGVRFADGPRDRPTWHYYGATIGELVAFLSLGSPNRPIHDETGLTGRYDFAIQVRDDPTRERDQAVYNVPVAPLGLELKAGKYHAFKLIIDHLERPSPN